MRTLLLSSIVFSAVASTSVSALTMENAQPHLTKTEVKEQAVDICRSETERRFGDSSVKYIAGKSKWSKDLDGAMVKMKIKRASKKMKKYNCLVKLDQSVSYVVR